MLQASSRIQSGAMAQRNRQQQRGIAPLTYGARDANASLPSKPPVDAPTAWPSLGEPESPASGKASGAQTNEHATHSRRPGGSAQQRSNAAQGSHAQVIQPMAEGVRGAITQRVQPATACKAKRKQDAGTHNGSRAAGAKDTDITMKLRARHPWASAEVLKVCSGQHACKSPPQCVIT